MHQLTAFDLGLASFFIILLAGLSWMLQLGIHKRIFISAVRTVVQLLFIGYILKILFEYVDFKWIALVTTIMLAIAAYEVMARQKRHFAGFWGYGMSFITLFISSFSITFMVLTIIINESPWYDPQFSIPLLGMMLGNSMTSLALTLDRLTQSTIDKQNQIEARLILGAKWKDAINDIMHDSVRIGMLPIINAMAAAGIVSLPGMMTGQILAGADPMDAVKYQILIMFMIAGGSGLASIIGVQIGARYLFDDRWRLRLDRLQ
ncbi:MAG: iron export ABC transporter permease subunit FetB [Thiohalomonadales bacterium]